LSNMLDEVHKPGRDEKTVTSKALGF